MSVTNELQPFIQLNRFAEKDQLIRELLRDVEWATENNYDDAFEYAINKNKLALDSSINSSRDEYSFWYILSETDHECYGGSIFDYIKQMVGSLYDMKNDDLMQNIIRGAKTSTIKQSIKDHEEEIIKKY